MHAQLQLLYCLSLSQNLVLCQTRKNPMSFAKCSHSHMCLLYCVFLFALTLPPGEAPLPGLAGAAEAAALGAAAAAGLASPPTDALGAAAGALGSAVAPFALLRTEAD